MTVILKKKDRFVIVVYFKMTPQRNNRVKVSALLRTGHKVNEVAYLIRVSRPTVYAIKKRMDDGEGVNRRADSFRNTGMDCGSLRDEIRSSPRTSMRQHARRLGIGTVRRAVAKLEAKACVIVERPLLTPIVSASSALNVASCSVMTRSLLGWKRDHLLS